MNKISSYEEQDSNNILHTKLETKHGTAAVRRVKDSYLIFTKEIGKMKLVTAVDKMDEMSYCKFISKENNFTFHVYH